MAQAAVQSQNLSFLPSHDVFPKPTALTFGGTFSTPMRDVPGAAGDPGILQPRIRLVVPSRSVSATRPQSDVDALPTSRQQRSRTTRHVTLRQVQ